MYARKCNSELEKLREEGLETQNLETIIQNVHPFASKIHAAYLFETEGKPLLQKLCLLVSATASGKVYGDWQKFAAYLGLVNEQIKCIDYDFKGLQDPTYYVLLTFVQAENATTDKIFLALQKIERLDVINRMTTSFNEFVDNIIKNQKSKDGIYGPSSLPKAPLVLSPVIQKQIVMQDAPTKSYSCASRQNIDKNMSQKYGSITMLTFAEDGRSTAEEIARIFRSNNPKIGVIILQEQERHVYSRAEEFVEDCFKQVNYIVPILTEGYLNKINNYVPYIQSDNNNLDSKYARYIFSMLRYEYIRQDCVNNRVRCIIPDADVKKVLSMDLHPTLQAWFRESDVHLFTERVLLQKL